MDIIKSSAEISLLFKKGRRVKTPYLTLIVMRNEQHGRDGRVAFIAGKRLGNAVWRNRAKRRMRGVYRDLNMSLDSLDIVFLARSGINAAPYDDLLRTSEKALGKL